MESAPPETWRLILTPPTDGATNMAIDEALLESVGAGVSPATLRLYSWEPACLSLGYAQPMEQVDLDGLRRHSWGLVRRPTGGRAILHVDELTYAVVAPASHPIMAGGVLASYRRMSAALTAGLAILGLTVETQPEGNVTQAERSNPVCFEVPSAYEMTVAGKKLVGSAQVRRRGAVLQHGTLPLCGDITRIVEALRYESAEDRLAAATRLRERAGTVESLTGRLVTWERAAESWIRGFTEALNLDLRAAALTPSEQESARRWRAERYAESAWTART